MADSLELMGVESLAGRGSQGRLYRFKYGGSQPQAAFTGGEVRVEVERLDAGWVGRVMLGLSADGFSPVGGFPSGAEAVDAMRRVAAEVLRLADRVVEDGDW